MGGGRTTPSPPHGKSAMDERVNHKIDYFSSTIAFSWPHFCRVISAVLVDEKMREKWWQINLGKYVKRAPASVRVILHRADIHRYSIQM